MAWTVRLIIILLIYIYIIYLIVKRVEKNVGRAILIILAVISMPIAYGISTAIVPYYYLAPFEGKVIDADTKSPVEGAAVLAVYYKEVPSIAGSNSYAIDAQETLTDKNGEFKIPEYKKWFGSNNGEPEGDLLIFKPGYGKFPGSEGVNIVGAVRATPEKYIVYELPKLKTKEERKNNLHHTSRPFHIAYEKMKEFTHLLNEERANLGYSPLETPKEERVK